MTPERLEHLLSAAVDGSISAEPGEREELNAALLKDDGLRHKAADWLSEESLLRQEAAMLPALTPNPVRGATADSAIPHLRGSRLHSNLFPPHSIAAAIGCIALACSLLLNVFLWQPNRGVAIGGDDNRSQQMARLTRVTGCIWESSVDRAPERGGVLSGGEVLSLLQGIAEIEVRNRDVQATVRLVGPCSVKTRIGDIPELQSGKMVIDARVFGRPLQLDSPLGALSLTDDASLGMMSTGDKFELHMLDGALDWTPDLAEVAAEPDLLEGRISEGEAVRCDITLAQAVNIQRIAAVSDKFAEERSMTIDRLELGERYQQLVLNSTPANYWRFSSTLKGHLNNEITGGIGLAVGGDVSTVSYGENTALEFGMTRQAGFLLSEDRWPNAPLKNLTVEVWAKPSHFHNGTIVALTADRSPQQTFPGHAMALELGGSEEHWRSRTPLNSLRYLFRDEPSDIPDNEFGSSVSQGYDVRRWQHLVFIKRGDRLELYRDGVRVASDDAGEGKHVAADLQLVCGRLYPPGAPAERLFIGQLDELALYERALSPEEVRSHHEAGSHKPPPADAI